MAVVNAPRTIPIFITVVPSANTLASRGSLRGRREGRPRVDRHASDRERLRAPQRERASYTGANAGIAVHHGAWTVPMTEPTMKKSKVTSIRVLPPPAV